MVKLSEKHHVPEFSVKHHVPELGVKHHVPELVLPEVQGECPHCIESNSIH